MCRYFCKVTYSLGLMHLELTEHAVELGTESQSWTSNNNKMKLRYLNSPCKICELIQLVASQPVSIFGFVLRR